MFFPCADLTQGLSHWPNARQDTKHPGSNSREIHPVPVQSPVQDPPVAHVLVCCHAASCSQLAVPQYYCSTGAGHRWHAGTVNSFTLTFPGVYRLKISLCPYWRFSSRLAGGTFPFFVMAVTGPWTYLEGEAVLVAEPHSCCVVLFTSINDTLKQFRVFYCRYMLSMLFFFSFFWSIVWIY